MQTKILVTGGTGMVGQHLKDLGLSAIYAGSKQADLTNYDKVDELFEFIRPTTVIHLAAKVGGIMDNIKNPIGFYEDNIYINTNVVKCAYKYGCTRFIGILSTCIYPDNLDSTLYPLTENRLHEGPPTITNFSYGYAKRCLDVQLKCYQKQHGVHYSSLIPCNLYSEYDHFEGDKAHFVTSLIRKIALAKIENKDYIELFGTGKPLRQFMYAEDFAKAIIQYVKSNYNADLNIATPEVFTIKQIAEIALEACNATHLKIKWDNSKPDGQYRKDVSDNNFKQLFPSFKYTLLKDGIKKTFDNYFHGLASKRI
jgi:GDP-L-fucose synthase